MFTEKKIEINQITPLIDPKFIKPVRINYTQSNRKKSWEAVKAHDSVAVLLYHTSKDAFLLVKQFRPAVFVNTNQKEGFTFELCAGIVDKEKTLVEIAKEEIFEECGYDVDVNMIEKITSFYTSVGFSGAKQTLFFAVVDDGMKTGQGGGIDDEEIELFYLPVKKAKEFMFDENYIKTPGLMMSFYWFFDNYDKIISC